MNLTETPDIVLWEPTHYVFIEKTGSFETNAPAAWNELHGSLTAVSAENKIERYISLYKIGPQVYRAGFALAAPPVDLPAGLAYEAFVGGKYLRFVLTGPYADIGPATARVWEIVASRKIPTRDDYAIENYVNDPRTTPPGQLITEILVPIA